MKIQCALLLAVASLGIAASSASGQGYPTKPIGLGLDPHKRQQIERDNAAAILRRRA